MKRIEFAQGLLKHFGIKDSSPFIDVLLLEVTGHCILDVLAFDDYLHKHYGDYEECGCSMAEFILDKFGKEADVWTKNAIEVS